MKIKKDTKRKRIVLLDAHAILHRAYHALPDFSATTGEPTGALYGLSLMIIAILKDLKPDYIYAAFDLPKPTYRHEVYKEYKLGRKKTDDNLIIQIKRARDLFKSFSIPIYEKEGYEADDVLGTLACELKKEFDVIIASGDMDTMQLIDDEKVRVYTLKKGLKDLVIYDEQAIKERYGFLPKQIPDYKGLSGDSSDNITGIPGIGEKTATTLIQNFGSIEGIYKNINNKEKFDKAGTKERVLNLLKEHQEEAEFSKMLATIDTNVPIHFHLSEKNWKESINDNEIRKFFRELEFKSLISRIDEVLEKPSLFSKNEDTDADNEVVTKSEAPKEKIDQYKFKKAKIALYLIDSTISNPEIEDIKNFAKTEDFEKALNILEGEITKRQLDFVYQKIEIPLIPIIEKMTECGVKVDKDILAKLSKEYHTDLDKAEREIWDEVGHEFNINSSQQLAEVLFNELKLKYDGNKKTSTGRMSTKEEVLEKLAENHQIAEKILEYRELQKLLSTYIDNLPAQISDDGRLRATFLQTGTTTGRLSSNNPNLQNIPVGSERGQKIRNAFIAEKGNRLISFDYSQVELRLSAILSQDQKLIQIFKDGHDVHTQVASEVFDVEPKDVTKEMRRQAKVINFGILYGMGVNSLRHNLKTDRQTAQKFYNQYFEVYSGLASYLDKAKKEVGAKGYSETLFGRRRYFEGFKSSLPYIRAQAERMAINAPIQGTQADMTKLAMVRVDEFLEKENLRGRAKLILQIHDEIIYEVDEKLAQDENFVLRIKEIMEKVLPKEKTEGVPIVVDSKAGNNWAELK